MQDQRPKLPEQKLRVDVKTNEDGKCLLTVRNGGDLVEVRDMSCRTYETNRLDQLVAYLKEATGLVYQIFYSSCGVVVLPSKTDYTTEPYATCNLEVSNQLAFLQRLIDNSMGVDDMESSLKRLRPHLDQAGMNLLLQCRDMVLQKVVNVKRQKTQSGDFLYHVEMKSGEGDWKPPEVVEFTVPIYKYHDHQAKIKTDLYVELVDLRGEDNKAVPKFRFEAPTIDDDLDEIRRRAIDRLVSDLPGKRYWGSARTNQMTDAWRYLSNTPDRGVFASDAD